MGDLGDSGDSPVGLLESDHKGDCSLDPVAPGIPGQVKLQGEDSWGKRYWDKSLIVVEIVPAGEVRKQKGFPVAVKWVSKSVPLNVRKGAQRHLLDTQLGLQYPQKWMPWM